MTRRYSEPAPTSYEELYDAYFSNADPKTSRPRVYGATCKFLPNLPEAEREDIISAIFEKCLKAKIIENYDPERAGFGSVFFLVVRSVCANWMRCNQNKPLVRLRGPSIVNREEKSRGDAGRGAVYGEKVMRPVDHAENQTHARRTLIALFEYAEACFENPTCNRDRVLLDVLVHLANGATQMETAERVGVSRATLTKWLTKHLPKKFSGLNEIF